MSESLGELQRAQESVASLLHSELLVDPSIWCSPEEWQLVLQDFRMAQSEFSLNLGVKTSFVQKLPWVLGGLAHHDPAVVQRIARQAITQWDETPEALQPSLHPIAPKFLSPRRRLRQEVERLAEGEPLGSMSARFKRHVAKFRFVSLSERIIEAGHKDIKTDVGHHKLKVAVDMK